MIAEVFSVKWLGITTRASNPNYSLTILKIYAQEFSKNIELEQLTDIALLEELFELKGEENYNRILIYDIDELDSWNGLKEFVNTYDKYNKDFSTVKQDLHSDMEIPLGYLTGVI